MKTTVFYRIIISALILLILIILILLIISNINAKIILNEIDQFNHSIQIDLLNEVEYKFPSQIEVLLNELIISEPYEVIHADLLKELMNNVDSAHNILISIEREIESIDLNIESKMSLLYVDQSPYSLKIKYSEQVEKDKVFLYLIPKIDAIILD